MKKLPTLKAAVKDRDQENRQEIRTEIGTLLEQDYWRKHRQANLQQAKVPSLTNL